MKVSIVEWDDGRKSPWCVRWFINRRPQRRFFRSMSEASAFRRDLRKTLRSGADPQTITRAIQLLAGTGINILTAVQAGIGVIRSKSSDGCLSTLTLGQAAEKIISRAKARQRRKHTIQSYEGHLRIICRRFGATRILASMSDDEVTQYLATMRSRRENSPAASYASKLSALTNLRMLSKEAGILRPFPTVELPHREHKMPGFFTPAEIRLMFAHAYAEERGMLAVALFAAMRPVRLNEFSPELFNLKERWIAIPGPLAKNGIPTRLQTDPANQNFPGPPVVLWEWLAAYPFQPVCWVTLQTRLSRVLGHWVHDGCRHTGATYYRVLHGIFATAELLTHNSIAITKRHYASTLATREQANEFLAITPASVGPAPIRDRYSRAKVKIPVEEMLELLLRGSMTSVGKQLGVTMSAIGKYMQRHGIPRPGVQGSLAVSVARYRANQAALKKGAPPSGAPENRPDQP